MTHTYRISGTPTKMKVLAKTTWGYQWLITRFMYWLKVRKKKDWKLKILVILKQKYQHWLLISVSKKNVKKILSVTSDTKLLNVVLFFSKRLPSFWKQSIFQGSHSNRVLSLEIKLMHLLMRTWTREKWYRTRNTDCCSKLSTARWENEQEDLAVVKVGCEVYIPSKCCSETLTRNTLLAVSWVLLRYKFQ